MIEKQKQQKFYDDGCGEHSEVYPAKGYGRVVKHSFERFVKEHASHDEDEHGNQKRYYVFDSAKTERKFFGGLFIPEPYSHGGAGKAEHIAEVVDAVGYYAYRIGK